MKKNRRKKHHLENNHKHNYVAFITNLLTVYNEHNTNPNDQEVCS